MTSGTERTLSAFELSLLESQQDEASQVIAARLGDICPQCGQAKLDYNGLLELECRECGFTTGGGAGCT
jgi:uncharacterized protein (DUF983 family)